MRAVRFQAVAPVAVNARDIDVTRLNFPAVGSLPLEIVERKGIGHPDTICDALVETISGELSRRYVAASGFADTSRIGCRARCPSVLAHSSHVGRSRRAVSSQP